MKIVPRVTKAGTRYVVRKDGLFGKRYLAEGGVWSSQSDFVDRHFFPTMLFRTPESAAEEVKTQFGTNGYKNIQPWEPK